MKKRIWLFLPALLVLACDSDSNEPAQAEEEIATPAIDPSTKKDVPDDVVNPDVGITEEVGTAELEPIPAGTEPGPTPTDAEPLPEPAINPADGLVDPAQEEVSVLVPTQWFQNWGGYEQIPLSIVEQYFGTDPGDGNNDDEDDEGDDEDLQIPQGVDTELLQPRFLNR
jgi:hypothetical protein